MRPLVRQLHQLLPGRVPRLSRAHGLELVARRRLAGTWAGRHRTVSTGSSLDVADHRDYQPGDDLRTIDWKAWARSDRLVVRRYHDERQLPLWLLVDDSASMDYGGPPTKAAEAVLLAAMLGLLAIDQADAVRVTLGDAADLPPWRGGPAGGSRLCADLCAPRRRVAADPAAGLIRAAERAERRCLLVVMSDLLGDPEPLIAAAAVARARGHEVAVWQVLDATELDLPAHWGACELVDPEDPSRRVSGEAPRLAGDYRAAFAAHEERLRQGLAGAQAGFARHLTHQDAAATLATWLRQRRRR